MGVIRIDIGVGGKREARVRALVDTGATFTVIPAGIARKIGLKPLAPIKVQLADGSTGRMRSATAMIRVNGRRSPATVLISPSGEVLLGAETLEVLGLSVDPKRRRLKVAHPFAIKAAWARGPCALLESVNPR